MQVHTYKIKFKFVRLAVKALHNLAPFLSPASFLFSPQEDKLENILSLLFPISFSA